MTKTKYGTELISEGCRSYHQALFAVMQFRRQVQQSIRAAVDDNANALAAALDLGGSELACADYAIPAQYQPTFDGSAAQVGLRCGPENWALYYYVWVGDAEDPYFGALLWLKNPGSTITTIAGSGDEDIDVGDDCIQLYEYLPADGSVDLVLTCSSTFPY